MHARDEIALFAGRFNATGVEYMITGATAAIIYGQPRGGSSKHPADIRAILATTGVDRGIVEIWVERLGLMRQWVEVRP